jgi:hypothetical protein
MGSTGVEVDQHFSLSTEMLDQPFFNRRLRVVTLLQIPITRQSEMKVDVMTVT